MSLFEASEEANRRRAQPLAARMRPATLDEFVGQQHFLGEGKLLRRVLRADRLGSVIFYGPPGTGKTTLARLLAGESRSIFRQVSAVTSSVKELREILSEARDRLAAEGRRTLLFIDEIHRFNKAQQDVLLPEVEDGVVILVGATTENPFFAINSALVSRSRVFAFQPLSVDDIKQLLHRALIDSQRGLGEYEVHMHADALEFLAETSDGDARRALAAMEIGVLSCPTRPVEFTRQLAEESVQRKAIQYDREGDVHYDSASALIKSIRGSDPDAGLYWLARMLEGGEDVRFLARRLVILASEDVGNADPAALELAVAAAQACELVGLPECQLNLAQAVTYLACAEVQRRHGGDQRSPSRRLRRAAPARPDPSPRFPLRWGVTTGAWPKLSICAAIRPKALPRRITLGSSASITAPRTGGLKRNSPIGWRRSAPGCVQRKAVTHRRGNRPSRTPAKMLVAGRH